MSGTQFQRPQVLEYSDQTKKASNSNNFSVFAVAKLNTAVVIMVSCEQLQPELAVCCHSVYRPNYNHTVYTASVDKPLQSFKLLAFVSSDTIVTQQHHSFDS